MNKAFKYILMSLFTLTLSYFCFVLPPRISEFTDQQKMEAVNTESLEAMNVEINQQMTMLDKLDLIMGTDKNYNIITISQGKKLTKEEAIETAKSEIDSLVSLGVIADWSEDMQEDKISAEPQFMIRTDDPTKSMILWNIILRSSDNSFILISMDDETGKILSITSKRSLPEPDSAEQDDSDLETSIQKLGEYLGIDISIGKPWDLPQISRIPKIYLTIPYQLTLKQEDREIGCILYISSQEFYFIRTDK